MELGLIGQNVMVNVSKQESGTVKRTSEQFLIRTDYRNHFIRNNNESNEEIEERDCQDLCFFDVTNDIDTVLGMCSIKKIRTRIGLFMGFEIFFC